LTLRPTLSQTGLVVLTNALFLNGFFDFKSRGSPVYNQPLGDLVASGVPRLPRGARMNLEARRPLLQKPFQPLASRSDQKEPPLPAWWRRGATRGHGPRARTRRLPQFVKRPFKTTSTTSREVVSTTVSRSSREASRDRRRLQGPSRRAVETDCLDDRLKVVMKPSRKPY
jgi:hypothetical protein